MGHSGSSSPPAGPCLTRRCTPEVWERLSPLEKSVVHATAAVDRHRAVRRVALMDWMQTHGASPTAVAAVAAVTAHCHGCSGYAFPGKDRLAEIVSVSLPTLAAALTEAADLDVITRTKVGRSTHYCLPFLAFDPAEVHVMVIEVIAADGDHRLAFIEATNAAAAAGMSVSAGVPTFTIENGYNKDFYTSPAMYKNPLGITPKTAPDSSHRSFNEIKDLPGHIKNLGPNLSLTEIYPESVDRPTQGSESEASQAPTPAREAVAPSVGRTVEDSEQKTPSAQQNRAAALPAPAEIAALGASLSRISAKGWKPENREAAIRSALARGVPLARIRVEFATDSPGTLSTWEIERRLDALAGSATAGGDPFPPLPDDADPLAKAWRRARIAASAALGLDTTTARSWLAPLTLTPTDDGTVAIAAPTSHARDWVAARYADHLKVALADEGMIMAEAITYPGAAPTLAPKPAVSAPQATPAAIADRFAAMRAALRGATVAPPVTVAPRRAAPAEPLTPPPAPIRRARDRHEGLGAMPLGAFLEAVECAGHAQDRR